MSGKNPLGLSREPQSYEGINVIVPLGGWQFVRASRAPNSNDKKYPFGTLWIDKVTQNIYFLTASSGTWAQVGSSASSLSSLTVSGQVQAASFAATGDPGAGVASQNIISNVSSTTISTGVGSIKMSTANAATNTGWLKAYIGTTVAWIPTFTTNAP